MVVTMRYAFGIEANQERGNHSQGQEDVPGESVKIQGRPNIQGNPEETEPDKYAVQWSISEKPVLFERSIFG